MNSHTAILIEADGTWEKIILPGGPRNTYQRLIYPSPLVASTTLESVPITIPLRTYYYHYYGKFDGDKVAFYLVKGIRIKEYRLEFLIPISGPHPHDWDSANKEIDAYIANSKLVVLAELYRGVDNISNIMGSIKRYYRFIMVKD